MSMSGNSEEKGLLGSSRSHRRYGSTVVNMKKVEYIVRHLVSKSDTLQGIALKYGVTVECVRHANRLHTNDHVFLHEFLEVPVSKEVYDAFSVSSCPTSPTPRMPTPEQPVAPRATSPRDHSDTDPLAFLSKIDSNIASMKTNINKFDTSNYPCSPTIAQMEVDDRPPAPSRLSSNPLSLFSSFTGSRQPSRARTLLSSRYEVNGGFETDADDPQPRVPALRRNRASGDTRQPQGAATNGKAVPVKPAGDTRQLVGGSNGKAVFIEPGSEIWKPSTVINNNVYIKPPDDTRHLNGGANGDAGSGKTAANGVNAVGRLTNGALSSDGSKNGVMRHPLDHTGVTVVGLNSTTLQTHSTTQQPSDTLQRSSTCLL